MKQRAKGTDKGYIQYLVGPDYNTQQLMKLVWARFVKTALGECVLPFEALPIKVHNII